MGTNELPQVPFDPTLDFTDLGPRRMGESELPLRNQPQQEEEGE